MNLRTTNIEKLQSVKFDVLILGGGINGAVSAAVLSARGAKVALIDKADFAGLTSSSSSNLAWGGIKYMETLEFPLVRKLCMSRNHLIRSYPSTVEEIRFFTTHEKNFRHGLWKLLAGTWLYWLIGNCFTKIPRLLTRKTIQKEEPFVNIDTSNGGFEYSDAYLHDNDARFVFNFIRSSLNYGCIAANYVESLGAQKKSDEYWSIKAKDKISGKQFTISAKILINACGPYLDAHNKLTKESTIHKHVFSKGIHLIVNQITPNKRVLTFFANDGRLFFVIPMGNRTCIGTTDTKLDTPESYVTSEDRKFVLDNINHLLKLPSPLTEKDIIAERCGVRPLVVTTSSNSEGDWMQLSRKHAVESNSTSKHISIFGGKLTDCLNVGEEIYEIVQSMGILFNFPTKKWYGEPSEEIKNEFLHQAKLIGLDEMTSPLSSEVLSKRLWRRYGAQSFALLENIRMDPKMAEILIEGSEYIRCEIEQTAKREMVTKLEDFLRRRSKIDQVVRKEELKKSKGLKEACKILFGIEATSKYNEYFSN
ncbi:MAG: FAD-dependent oxidoreductase [Leptospiraceae bacterium]|nr:FAD-dependent oxidoreductase [Leptospiraceae bacterium]MCK6379999.1 FAD-dependent oxidoreductase [Leptospiraceae bacterium]NUM40158.1 FAD-dependent oxidoreductase [Leptospiraceae bacterium]